MEAITTKNINNEMLMEQFFEMKSMIAHLQSEIETLKNPVDSFLTKWNDTFEAKRMLGVSRRTIDNYIKAGKLKPIRINKRNHFAVSEVTGLMHVPEIPKIRSYQDDIQTMLKQLARMNEMGEDW
jgi:adenosyl cobinamide kinase/adenosyl cobinamide phosphate guanylyltransferase